MQNGLRMLRADLSPIFEHHGYSLDESSIEDWEGAVMFEGPANSDFDKMEEIAQTTVDTWAEINEWTVETICTGLYRLTPREWTTKPPPKPEPECHACRYGDGPCRC